MIGLDQPLSRGLVRLLSLALPAEGRAQARSFARQFATNQSDRQGAQIFFGSIALTWLLISCFGSLAVIAFGTLSDSLLGWRPSPRLIDFFVVSGVLGAVGAGIGFARYHYRGMRDNLAARDVALGGAWNVAQLGIAAVVASVS